MQVRLEEIMLSVSRSPLIDAGHLEEAIRLVLDSICRGLAVARAGVWFFDQDAGAIRCSLLIDQANDSENSNILLIERDYPRYFAALQRERAVVANDACTDPATSEFRDDYLVPLGVSSMMDVPIRHHGKMLGIICAEHTGPARRWTSDEVTFAGALGDLVGRAINARASCEAQAELAALNEALESRIEERTRDLANSNAELRSALEQLTRARDELVRSEKLAALGSLVAGVAHELNTPIGNSLTVASTLSEEVAAFHRDLAGGPLRRVSLERHLQRAGEASLIIVRNIARAAELVSNFKQIAVDQTSDRRRSFDLALLINDIVQTQSASWLGDGPSVVLDVSEGLGFDSFPGALGQILQNLMQNARLHAFAGGKTGEIRIHARRLNDRLVRLVVADNGCGIPLETLPRIFDPFFTTRLGQGGSGLGLHIVHNLVYQLLGGQIKVNSRLAQGTEFLIELPMLAPAG